MMCQAHPLTMPDDWMHLQVGDCKWVYLFLIPALNYFHWLQQEALYVVAENICDCMTDSLGCLQLTACGNPQTHTVCLMRSSNLLRMLLD